MSFFSGVSVLNLNFICIAVLIELSQNSFTEIYQFSLNFCLFELMWQCWEKSWNFFWMNRKSCWVVAHSCVWTFRKHSLVKNAVWRSYKVTVNFNSTSELDSKHKHCSRASLVCFELNGSNDCVTWVKIEKWKQHFQMYSFHWTKTQSRLISRPKRRENGTLSDLSGLIWT